MLRWLAAAAALLLLTTPARADVDEAVTAYRRAVSLDPQLVHTIKSPEVRAQLRADFLEAARVARKAGQLPEAERNYLLAGNFEEDFELFQELGEVYLDMESWSKAVVLFKKAVAERPGDAGSMGRLARAYQKAGQEDLAAQFYARAISLDPRILPQLQMTPELARKVRGETIERAKSLALRKQPLDAAGKMDLALALGDSAELRVEQAGYYKAAGDEGAAARAYAVAVDLDEGVATTIPQALRPLVARELYTQGVEIFQAKDLERARHLFERSLVMGETARAFYNLGNVFVHGGKLDQALRYYEQAIEADPRLDEARLNRAMVLMERGLHGAAIRELRGLVAQNPGRSEAYDLIAQAYSQLGKPAKAVKVYQAAVNFDPALATKLTHPEVRQAAALAFFEEARQAFEGKDFSTALERCNRSIALHDSPRAHYMIGNARFALDDPLGAVASYERALQLAPDHAPTHNNLGNAYLKLKDYPKAVLAFRKAVEFKSDYAQAYNNLGIALRKAGKRDEAIKAYKKALEIDPNYAAAYFNLGNAYQGG